MKVCTNCGHRDNPYWRHSRFDYNADYMSEDDFKREYPDLHKRLVGKHPMPVGNYIYYRRGRRALQVYRVAMEDYEMPRERKKH